MAQVLVSRPVGLKPLSAMVRLLASLLRVVSSSLVLFRTGSGVRTPLVTLSVPADGALLVFLVFPLRTVATVQDISKTVIIVFRKCSPLSIALCCVWCGVERHLRETFTAPLVPLTPFV